MNIAFDVDGVVLKSIELILESINRVTGRNICPEDLSSWELEPLGLDSRTLHDAVAYMYAQPRIEPYDGAVESLSRIYRVYGRPLLFITGRSDPDTARRQLEALPWNPTVPEMIVTGGSRDKRTYLAKNAVDFLVEDDIKHIEDYVSNGFKVGLMLQPWNRLSRSPVTRKFDGWGELESWFMEIFHRKSSHQPQVTVIH
jgi:hypothetical protein